MEAPVVVDCRFQRYSCGHDLFQQTYTRSNRTRGAKIMRCFPHCCPEHMPRCYCGCSLQVLVTFEDASAVRHQDLVVCARFETSEMQEAADVVSVGHPLVVPSAILSSNLDDANGTSWVVAEKESDVKQRQLPPNAVLYVLNNNRFPRWYYSYESGATKNQREMRHHLTAYVLRRMQSPTYAPTQRVAVLGRVASPAFAIISYRRARADVKKPAIPERENPFAALEERPSVGDEDDDDDDDDEAKSVSVPAQPTVTESDDPIQDDSEINSSGNDSPVSLPDAPRPSLARELAVRRATANGARRRPVVSTPDSMDEPTAQRWQDIPVHRKRKVDSVPADRSALEWRFHGPTTQRIAQMQILLRILDRLTLQDVEFCLREHTDRLRDHWFGVLARMQEEMGSDDRLHELAGAFSLNSIANAFTSPQHSNATSANRPVQARTIALFVKTLTSPAVLHLLESTWWTLCDTASLGQQDKTRRIFNDFVVRLYDAIDSLHKIDALIDAAVSMVFTEPSLLPLRREAVELLRDGAPAAERWYQLFVAQWRVAISQQRERQAAGTNVLRLAIESQSSIWEGQWVMDVASFKVRRSPAWRRLQDTGTSPLSPLGSVLSSVLLLRQWLAVHVSMDGSTLSVRSLLTGRYHPGMQLVLDERRRVFQCFPDGTSSVVGGGSSETAWFHGDYVGRGHGNAHEIVCEAFSLHRADPHVLLQRVFVKASVVTGSEGDKRCTLAVKFATATTQDHTLEQLVTQPVAERHQLYGDSRWTVMADVEVSFSDLR